MLSGHASQTTPPKKKENKRNTSHKAEYKTQWLRALDSIPSTYMAANNYL